MGKTKISVTLPYEDVEWLEAEIERIGKRKTNKSEQVHIAIVQRRLSKMPKWQREEIYGKLGIKEEAEKETPGQGPDQEPEVEDKE